MPIISVKGSETTWRCEEGDTITRSALRAGLGFPYECNVGSCGNCRFELIDGEISHLRADPPGLDERDRAKNRALGCQARPLSDCHIKVRFASQYVAAHAPKRQSAVLIATQDVSHDIREFRFSLETPMPFLAGQYALLSVPGVDGARAYSMCNTGETGKEWHFQIRRVPAGHATTALFETLVAGDSIAIDGPYGMAYLRDDSERDIICIAGGSGLSPMISIARAAAAAPSLVGRQLDFIYGGRTALDICAEPFLEVLDGFGERIRFHPAVSMPDDGSWNGFRGFVHELAEERLGHRLVDSEIYFAGPPAMGQALQALFVAKGVPQDQIHFDQFY